jgi:ABC-2 type transport system ATP-binding protein
MSSNLIELSGLSQFYGDFQALNGLDAVIPTGSIGLVGANGAGKSTLFKVLLGILSPTQGGASVLGHSVADDTIALRARVGYMPERGGLPGDQTAADFMIYAARLAGVAPRAAKQRASDVLTLVGLHEERFRYLGDFSTGMRQRALLAQAIVHDPDVVFLDEPIAGLDPEGRDEMLRLVGRLQGFGINTIVSSHVLADIESTCDWVVMLEAGRLVRNGPLHDGAEGGTVHLEVPSRPEMVEAELRSRGATVRRTGHALDVSAHDADPYDLIMRVLADTSSGIRVLRPTVTTLEDAFLAQDREPA